MSKGSLDGHRAHKIAKQAWKDAKEDKNAPVLSSIISGLSYKPERYSSEEEREFYKEAYRDAYDDDD